MHLKEPSWWYAKKPDWRANALKFAAKRYAATMEKRFDRHAPYHSRLPVICIGNLTAGGAGKTPMALYTASQLIARGEKPVFLTRGFGGRKPGPIWVDTDKHTASDVGDEPLMLASNAPTMVSRDRRLGTQRIESHPDPFSAIIMDDGLQNPGLFKDFVIAVIDGQRGLGNGCVIPAGPLRGSLEFQLEKIDAIVINIPSVFKPNESFLFPDHVQHQLDTIRRKFNGPILQAVTAPKGDVSWLCEKPIVAFAGIGHPARFFKMLASLGAKTVAEMPYGDHHQFSESDAETLLTVRARYDAVLVTTEKDKARLSNVAGKTSQLKHLANRTRTVSIETTFDTDNQTQFSKLLDEVMKSGGYNASIAKHRL